MTRISTPTQLALYRDVFGLTVDEIDQIAVGTSVRERLPASRGSQQCSAVRPPRDTPMTPCADRAALSPLD
ncbi:hypothetical protein BLA23254_07067 [Burkholderia lata]|uniref:Uncharacterized protein n=1 Tax=Burkholderia lata (strain ATCC 17760 / DSM 23089 / LMG 22485 / NCIMB 9086 / R18194 / 383) TaxID=482957 RepID=A0A6P2RYE2_BURL3|nr:hypothetical protein [Burkholderia lata]VWC42285.1 hypothetical protein BLA23254_07067 [Burkholderia lata]